MRRALLRSLKSLALLPLTAWVVFELLLHLPVPHDEGRKTQSVVTYAQRMEELHLRGPGGFLHLWQAVFRGERLGGSSALGITGSELLRALGLSARLGAGALGLAFVWAALWTLARLTLRSRVAQAVLGILPALVYGTPVFLLGLLVLMATAVPNFNLGWNPFLAAGVMSVGPGIFLGVLLHDALRREEGRPYFLTALAKGLSPSQALLRHAFPNALPTLLDALPPTATALLAGSFVAEQLFDLKGFGFLYVYSAQRLDLPVVVVAATLFSALLFGVSAAVTVAHFAVDPRARAAPEADR